MLHIPIWPLEFFVGNRKPAFNFFSPDGKEIE